MTGVPNGGGMDRRTLEEVLATMAWWREVVRDGERLAEQLRPATAEHIESCADAEAEVEQAALYLASVSTAARRRVDDTLATVERIVRQALLVTSPEAGPPSPLHVVARTAGRSSPGSRVGPAGPVRPGRRAGDG